MELEWIFIFSIAIMVCELDSRIFGESIVEASEEISFTKDIGIIGDHYCYFTKGTASAGDWILSIIEFFLWERHCGQFDSHGLVHIHVQP